MLVRKSLTFTNTSKLLASFTLLGGSAVYLKTHQKQRPTYPSYFNQALTLMQPSQLAFCEEARRVYIGLSVRSMMDQPGMMVLLVNTESPAWQGDMKVGDILLEIDGQPINIIGDLHKAVDGA